MRDFPSVLLSLSLIILTSEMYGPLLKVFACCLCLRVVLYGRYCLPKSIGISVRPPYLVAEAIFCVGLPGHVTWWAERYDSGVRSIGQLVIRLVFALVKWNFHYRFFNQGVFKAGFACFK